MYQSNPVGMVDPPQVNSLIGNGTMNLASIMPQLVSASYNAADPSETLVFNVTNPTNLNFTLKSAYAEVRDQDDQTFLANATLANPVFIQAGETVNVTIVCRWTTEAETYFQTTLAGNSTINVDLSQATINVNDVTITLSQPIEISNLPITAAEGSI